MLHWQTLIGDAFFGGANLVSFLLAIYHKKLQETLLVLVLPSDYEQSEFDMLNYFTCISAPKFRRKHRSR